MGAILYCSRFAGDEEIFRMREEKGESFGIRGSVGKNVEVSGSGRGHYFEFDRTYSGRELRGKTYVKPQAQSLAEVGSQQILAPSVLYLL